jgi:hypothetical protein
MYDCKRCGDTHYWDNECSATAILEKEIETLHQEVLQHQSTIGLLKARLSVFDGEPEILIRVVEEAQKLCASLQTEGRGNSLALEKAVNEYNKHLARKIEARTG